MRMFITVSHKTRTLDAEGLEGESQRKKLKGTNAVKIELQHAIATSKYKWDTLSAEQKRTNVLRGRLERSKQLRHNQAELHGQAQEHLALQDHHDNI